MGSLLGRPICRGQNSLLGAYGKLRKTAFSFVIFVRPSFRPHGTTRLSLDGFSWNLAFEDFSKICWEKFKFNWIRKRIAGILHEDQYTFLIISRSFLIRTRNVTDKSCRENQNTHFVCNNFFSKILSFMR